MAETTQQWLDSGSGPGHMQAVFVTKRMRMDAAYRELLDHTSVCKGSCSTGANCDEATALQRTWRDLKNGVAS